MSEIFVNQTSPLQQLQNLESKKEASAPGGKSDFSELLTQAMGEVNQLQKVSDHEISKVLTGEINDVHTAMMAMRKADLSFQMLMQVRNKLVEAYQEVMRMQV